MSADGTDFHMAMQYMKAFWSYKFKASGLRYEVGLCIKTGDIVWIHGPFPPGDWNDNMIFQNALMHHLEDGERVETDMGYRGSFPTVSCPPFFDNPDTEDMAKRVRLRHETCNRRFKMWNILKAPFRHDILDHQAVFSAIACITQLSFESGEPLFPVDYDD